MASRMDSLDKAATVRYYFKACRKGGIIREHFIFLARGVRMVAADPVVEPEFFAICEI